MNENLGNPYEAPKADVNAQVIQPGPSGSIDDAIAGRYNFEIGDVMREAWDLTRGMKASFWGAAIILYVAMIAISLASTLLGIKSMAFQIVFNVVFGAAAYVIAVGLLNMGVRRAAGLPINFGTAFSLFDRAGTAFVAGLLTTLFTYIGIILLVIPGIYLAMAYCQTMPLIADRNMKAWEAMETSRKAVTKRWFKYFGLFFVVGLLACLSALPLGIGLIWTAPWSICVIGVVYRRTFGIAQIS